MNKHTPAPWTLFDGKSSSLNEKQLVMGNDRPANWYTQDGQPDNALEGRIIATVNEDTESFGKWTDNARLIAAAPELLAALEKIDALCIMAERDQLEDWADLGARIYLLKDEARAAISKATQS